MAVSGIATADFNSSMVRLKVKLFEEVLAKYEVFQFQYGAIES